MNAIESIYIDKIAHDPDLKTIEIEKHELKHLEESYYFLITPQKPMPPIKTFTETKSKSWFGETSTSRKEYDNHAPEYLKALEQYYTALQSDTQKMFFMGRRVTVKA